MIGVKMLVLVKVFVLLKKIDSMFIVYFNNASWKKIRHLNAQSVWKEISLVNRFKHVIRYSVNCICL